MKVTMIGTGYVGLVSGVCFSEFGYDVTCADVDAGKIDALRSGKVPIFEPGLEELIAKNGSRLHFTTDVEGAVSEAEIAFVAVGTPSRRGDGEADLSFVHAAARTIAGAMRPGTVVVIKSTVVVGTTREVGKIIAETAPDKDFSVVANPEFLREGAAIEDFMRPDRIVVGAHDERGVSAMRRLYRPLYLRETPIVVTGLENAELIKYASNAFLAMKITFINEMADMCEKVGGDVQEVAKAIGLDNRIGSKFLHPGPGYGGSCFPKDTRALTAIARKRGAPLRLIETVIDVNERRKSAMADKVIDLFDDMSGRTIGILGIAFKPNTDDLREAPSLALVAALRAAGASIRAHDPQARPAGEEALQGVAWCESAYEVAEDADALVIVTEWNEYRALDLGRLKSLMRGDVLVDLRNIYRPDEAATAGLRYVGVGRSQVGSA